MRRLRRGGARGAEHAGEDRGAGGDAGARTTPRPRSARRSTATTRRSAERDFDKACDGLAPETTAKLRENVKKLGVTDPPEDCGELLENRLQDDRQGPRAEEADRRDRQAAEIDKVTVTGDTAKIDWSATANGQKTPISQTARRIDGEWKLVDVTN